MLALAGVMRSHCNLAGILHQADENWMMMRTWYALSFFCAFVFVLYRVEEYGEHMFPVCCHSTDPVVIL